MRWMRWMRWVDMMRLLWFYGWCLLKCMRWWWGWAWTGGWGSLAYTPSSQWTSTWQQTLGKNNWSKFLRFPRLEYDLVTCGKPLPLFAFTKTDYKQTVIILFRDIPWLSMTNNKPLFGWWTKIVIIPIISLKTGAFQKNIDRDSINIPAGDGEWAKRGSRPKCLYQSDRCRFEKMGHTTHRSSDCKMKIGDYHNPFDENPIDQPV